MSYYCLTLSIYLLFDFRLTLIELMDLQVNYNMNPEDAHCHQSYHYVSSTDINNSRCNSICSSNYVFNTNDHTTLIPTCAMKNKKYDCQNPHSDAKELSKPNTQITLLWITIIHIFCLVRN